MKNKILLPAFLIGLLASGCTTCRYYPIAFTPQTNVTLSQANFRVVKHLDIIVEVACDNHVPSEVTNSAYAELLRAADLRGSQALINVAIEQMHTQKSRLIGSPVETQFIGARGTVIEFLDDKGQPVKSETPETIHKVIKAQRPTNKPANAAEATRAPKTKQGTTQRPASKPIVKTNVASSTSATQAAQAKPEVIVTEGNVDEVIARNTHWMPLTIQLTRNVSHDFNAQYDLNSDGKIQESELEMINSMISKADQDEDARLTGDEVKKFKNLLEKAKK